MLARELDLDRSEAFDLLQRESLLSFGYEEVGYLIELAARLRNEINLVVVGAANTISTVGGGVSTSGGRERQVYWLQAARRGAEVPAGGRPTSHVLLAKRVE